jgi:hypothetical protein
VKAKYSTLEFIDIDQASQVANYGFSDEKISPDVTNYCIINSTKMMDAHSESTLGKCFLSCVSEVSIQL